MPETKPIDLDVLKKLASIPGSKVGDICEELGVHYSTLNAKLKSDPALKQVWDEARAAEREARGAKPQSARAPHRRSKKKSTKSNTPPRNGNAKVNKELFRKLQHEFDHIDLYGAVSEHFDELRDEVAASL